MKRTRALLMTIALSAATSAAFAATAAAPATTGGAALISKLTRDQVTVAQSFPAPDHLTGYVVTPKTGGRSMIMYTDATGSFLFVGNLVDQNGNNLTEQYTDQYINAKLASQAQNSIADQAHYFTEGSDAAPHKLYVFFDPNCSACHIFYTTIQSAIQAKQVQIRWIPVAFLKSTSDGIAAKILSGKTDADRAALLNHDEKGFNMQTENGGLTPLAENKSNSQLFDMVKQNTAYFTSQGFYVTPTLLYKKQDGSAGYTAGAVPSASLDQFLAQVGKDW